MIELLSFCLLKVSISPTSTIKLLTLKPFDSNNKISSHFLIILFWNYIFMFIIYLCTDFILYLIFFISLISIMAWFQKWRKAKCHHGFLLFKSLTFSYTDKIIFSLNKYKYSSIIKRFNFSKLFYSIIINISKIIILLWKILLLF